MNCLFCHNEVHPNVQKDNGYRTGWCNHCPIPVFYSWWKQKPNCDHYNLHFSHNNKSYVLRATPSTPFIKFYNNKWNLVFFKKAKFTELLVDYQQPPIIRVPFIPLSTNNDMHEHAIWLFNKLRNLIIFS